jgi:hypothetical protein
MALKTMPIAKLQDLKSKIEAAIDAKVSERRRELETELSKGSVRRSRKEVTINHGLHWHGLVLAARIGTRLQERLDAHFREKKDAYSAPQLHHIDVQRMTRDPEYLTDYGMKALKRTRFSGDDILSFPRTVSELPGTNRVRAAGEKLTYDFQRG